MKNFFFTFLLVVFSFGAARGQITLDGTIAASNGSVLNIVRFGLTGDQLVLLDPTNNNIEIYSLSQALVKTIYFPAFITGGTPYSINFISDNLFDTDSSIEYLALTSYP